MKVKLVGIQRVDFTVEDTGERIDGNKLHVVSDLVENGTGMVGQRVAAVFTKLDIKHLKVGGNVELVYEQLLGSNKSRLVAVLVS